MMSRIGRPCSRAGRVSRVLLVGIGCGGWFGPERVYAQARESLAGERAAQTLQALTEAEVEKYNLRYGPLRFRAGARLGVSFTDNVFYSNNPRDDFLINPEVTLSAIWPVTERNALRASLNIGYEWYLKNPSLNGEAPLINPGSEVSFYIFVGDFRIRLHERFSYQESLFFNSFSGEDTRFYNFNNVGKFSRFDNETGFHVDWDLNKVVLSAEYNHENFISTTSSFDYLTRASEWFTMSAGFSLGDQTQAGLEAQASLHDYRRENVLSDNWRARVGPFVEVKSKAKIGVRAGAGFDTSEHDEIISDNSDYESYYVYAKAYQQTRLFAHGIALGREHLLGSNADNLETTYARYTISSPVMHHINLEGDLSVNLAKEFGGSFHEEFTYYGAGVGIGWQFHKFWRADLRYEFLLKDSDLPARDFQRNRLTLVGGYSF
jgi:hypothetical protein